jgi:hypothetical protein
MEPFSQIPRMGRSIEGEILILRESGKLKERQSVDQTVAEVKKKQS